MKMSGKVNRKIKIAAAQLGPINKVDGRPSTIRRLLELMREAASSSCDLVVFPELAFTPFFPHWNIEDEGELESYFESEMPNQNVQALFDEARKLEIGFSIGYAELAIDDGIKKYFNTSILVDKSSGIIGKYRKIHLPGFRSPQKGHPFQNLEKMYFEPGNLGFGTWETMGAKIGMCICYDRRWPESFRSLGAQGADIALLGYNTPMHNPLFPESDHLTCFHNALSMQAGAYQNGMWVVGVAKAGCEEGVMQIGQSSIIAPSGEIVSMCTSLEDELIYHSCDLGLSDSYKSKIFAVGSDESRM